MKRAALVLLASAALIAAGWATYPFIFRRAVKPTETVQIDTLVIRDTVTYTKTDIKYVHIFHTTTDTVVLYDLQHDTVRVEVPIEHKREHYEDADVWYHGYRAGIDSLAVYPKTVVVTVKEREKRRPKPWGIGVQAGYGITAEGGPGPTISVGVSYNLIRF